MISSKEEIVSFLQSVPAWYLATVEDTPAGPAPHVRPFSFAELQDGQIVFCTSKAKDVYREMLANPNVELTAWKPGSGWLIMRGQADLRDIANAQTRQEGFRHMVALGESWDSPDDEDLTFFTITGAEAWYCEIDGSWTKIACEGSECQRSGDLTPSFEGSE